ARALVLPADELVRPRPLAAFGGVIRERVTDVLEALEVVGAREVRAEPVVRARALTLRVGARALEVLRPKGSPCGQSRPQRPSKRRGRLAVQRPADAGGDRGRAARTQARDRRELAVVGRGGAKTTRYLPPDADGSRVGVEGPVVSARAGIDVVLDDVSDVQN